MGQQHSHQNLSKIPQKIFHPNTNTPSSAYTVRTQDNKKYIQYQLAIISKTSCKMWEQQLKEYYTNIDTSFLYLPLRYYYRKTQFCGSGGVLDILYEYYPMNLKVQIQNRSNIKNKFKQSQIWILLYILCSATNELHQNDKKIGKFALEHILLNKQTKQIKVATGLTFYSDSAVSQIIAPQSTVIHSKGFHRTNASTEEAFCIGIIVLCAMLLIYKIEENQFVIRPTQILQNLLSKLQAQSAYSKQLKQIVIRMCKINPNHRLTADLIVGSPLSPQMILKQDQRQLQQTAQTIIKQNDLNIELRPSRRLTLTLGSPTNQLKQILQGYSPTQPKNSINSLQKTSSQYVDIKNQKNGSKSVKKQQQISDFLKMVDQQLQFSRRSYKS